ncbi:MAG: S8 family serine peptidase [Muribaculaceae bacterium]|nr:S8 family serine peptidase [Muribaculaceae bacterium]
MRKIPLLMLVSSFLVNADNPAKLTSNTIMDLMARERAALHAKDALGGELPDAIPAYVKYNDPSCVDSLAMLGVTVQTVTPTVLTALIPVERVEDVAALQSVVCIQGAQKAKMLMDLARADTRVTDIHAASAPLETPFSGKGTIVGVIDGGVDFNHPAFFAQDGTTLRIKKVWCQADETGVPPAPYSYGSCYDTQEGITARGTDMAYYSHGCHVMGIAAGSDMESPYHGVAYDADLVFSSFKDIDTGISDAIKFIFDYADEAGKPAVINMSLGTEMGPHDGSSLRDQMIDQLSGEGRIVVGAGGNNALINMHISKTMADADDRLFAGVGFLEGMSGIGELQIWGEPGAGMKVRVCTVDKETMEPVYQSRAFNAANDYSGTVTLQQPYDESGGYFSIVTQRSPLNDRPMAHIQLAITDYRPTKVIAIIVTADPGTTVHAWANENYCCFLQHLPVMDIPDNRYGTCEIGGVGKSIITVASYSTRNSLTKLDGSHYESGFPMNDIAPYSNVGPTVDGRMKPDIAAPGSLIVSAFNGTNSQTEQVAAREWNGKTYYYGVYQGTSMASPHVAGIVATWLQACPTLTPDNLREVFAATARHDEFTGDTPGNTWGYGKIDAYAGLVYVLKNFTSQSGIDPVADGDWSAQMVDGQLRVLYYRPTASTRVTVHTPEGKTVLVADAGPMGCGDEFIPDTGDLTPGLYIMEISAPGRRESIKYLKR